MVIRITLNRLVATLATAALGLAMIGLAAVPAAAAPFDISNVIIPSGTTPNGTSWSTLSGGSNPVAYFNWSTGELQLDPKGRDISSVTFNYGVATSIVASTPGPFTYATGTSTGAISTSSVSRTLPAGSYLAVTTFAARLFGSLLSPTLATTGSNTASTTGWFNEPWNFGALAPTVNSAALVYSSTAGEGFRASGGGASNLLGFGTGIGMFSYTVNAVTGTQYGAVIPVQAVPEPSTVIMAGLGLAAAAVARSRLVRRSRPRSEAAVA